MTTSPHRATCFSLPSSQSTRTAPSICISSISLLYTYSTHINQHVRPIPGSLHCRPHRRRNDEGQEGPGHFRRQGVGLLWVEHSTVQTCCILSVMCLQAPRNASTTTSTSAAPVPSSSTRAPATLCVTPPIEGPRYTDSSTPQIEWSTEGALSHTTAEFRDAKSNEVGLQLHVL